MSTSAAAAPSLAVHRIEVRRRAGQPDPTAAAVLRQARAAGVEVVPAEVHAARVYLLEASLTSAQVETLASSLFADPVTETYEIGATGPQADCLIEVHPLPGVMDPAAEAIETAIRVAFGFEADVQTGMRYDFAGLSAADAHRLAERILANTVVHAIHDEPFHPESFPHGAPRSMAMPEVPIRDLDDAALERLSRDGHLFLSLDEMRAIQAEYVRQGREPREIELETLAQTWSEHCVHKTLKARVRYREDGSASPALDAAGRTGWSREDDGAIVIDNLLKRTVAAATHELMNDGVDWCLSVFVDNAGIVAFDDEVAVCFKVETHNHPSALEPYGGAATGIGGCIRDIIGTGLAAKPIANTDIFCVARPDHWTRGEASGGQQVVPDGCLHPRRILTQVVAGVRDYGNRMGIPTLNGAVWFDDNYIGNPLVYCGCVGVMPRDLISGDPQPGDCIIALGGRTGRDGIHGATFSSAELTDSHADEFSHAVQIGAAITEKKVLDAILVARDQPDGPLFTAITDCGAGGFSSAVGEMGETLGAEVHLDRAPLKYAGLTPTEIWISEAQERMVLAVPAVRLEELQAICDEHDVELCNLGTFGTDDRELVLKYDGAEVGRLSMSFMHDGLPDVVREAAWSSRGTTTDASGGPASTEAALTALLGHPNIASKHWIIRQYDHEVQGGSVVNPLVGPGADAPSDASVIAPNPKTMQGLAIANGLATGWSADPYRMTLAAIDECVRNLVCVGADPERIAILDNFCWPSCKDPSNLGDLVRAAAACYDGAMAYRTPFISGKDSLNNQFTTEDGRTIQIPPTLLISGFAPVADFSRCVTMDAKQAGSALVLVGATQTAMGGSHYAMLFDDATDTGLPEVDLAAGPATARAIHAAINAGLVRSAHDCSEGGVLVAAAEMAFGGRIGLDLDLAPIIDDGVDFRAACFGESPSRYLLEVAPERVGELSSVLGGTPHAVIGSFAAHDRLTLAGADLDVSLADLLAAWRAPLDW